MISAFVPLRTCEEEKKPHSLWSHQPIGVTRLVMISAFVPLRTCEEEKNPTEIKVLNFYPNNSLPRGTTVCRPAIVSVPVLIWDSRFCNKNNSPSGVQADVAG